MGNKYSKLIAVIKSDRVSATILDQFENTIKNNKSLLFKTDKDANSLLHVACKSVNFNCIVIILKHSSSYLLNPVNRNGNSAIDEVNLEHKDADIVLDLLIRTYLKYGTHFDVTKVFFNTIIHQLIASFNTFITVGINVNQPDSYGEIAMVHAIRIKNWYIIQELIKYNANISIKCYDRTLYDWLKTNDVYKYVTDPIAQQKLLEYEKISYLYVQ